MELTEILAMFSRDGGARMWAAALLFLFMFVAERVPLVGAWLSQDGPSPWLTAKRKKLATNVLLALAPAATLLASGAPLLDVLATAVTASLVASGINGTLNAALKEAQK